jgi:hypothetical protein
MHRDGAATHSEQNLRMAGCPQLCCQKAAKIRKFNRLIEMRCGVAQLCGNQQQMLHSICASASIACPQIDENVRAKKLRLLPHFLAPMSAFERSGPRCASSGEGPMDKFVARLNVEHYRKKLAVEADEAQRQKLLQLLAEEEAKLAAIEAREKARRRV